MYVCMALIDKKKITNYIPKLMGWEKFLIILKPFEDATKNTNGGSYCSASLVMPITNGLINVYSKANEYPHEIMSHFF